MSSPQHALYLPRLLLDWLRETPDATDRVFEGTAVFADVSGFTALTEQLAREQGKVGAEAITRIMNDAFAELVEIVFMEGGDLLRYGGDALFCFFEGDDHAGRAARACIDMSKEITEIDAGPVQLGISIGLASGAMEVMIVGDTEREMFFRGPVVDACIDAEAAADTGQVFAPPEFADSLPGATFEPAGEFVELVEDDPDTPFGDGPPDVKLPEGQDYSAFVSSDLRERLTLALVGGEHRPASIGFVMYRDGVDMSVDDRVTAMDDMFRHFRAACDRHHVAYLQNDVYPGGGKFLIADGVPQRSGGSEGVAAALFDIVGWDGPFQLRGGCARGYVFAGDLGAPNRRAYTVMADTANLAARLAAKAGNGEVFVTSAALDRSRGAFATQPTEAFELKGKSMAVRPLRVVSVSAERESEAEIPLFGRERELDLLRRTLATGLAGQRSVVSLVAELGLGKSLLAEVAAADLGRVISVRCGAEIGGGPGFVGRLLEEALALGEVEDIESALKNIARGSERTSDDDVALIARTFGVAAGGDQGGEAAQQMAVWLGGAVADLLGDLLGAESIIFRFENVHRAGMAAKAVIGELIERTANHAWAALVLADEPVDWVRADTEIVLEPFDVDTAHAFVAFLLGDSALPSQIVEQVIQRGMGNPYVLQELTTSALAGGAVPESIEAAAVAKMDRLDPRDEQLLCLAAVLGTEARIELLTAVLPDAALAEDAASWARLQDFVDTTTVGKIRFRDPVLRDAAYGMLPQRRREEAHARVAEAIEQRARRRPERYAGELSFHFHRARNWDKSWEYSRMSGDAASRRFDPYAAVLAYRQALEAAGWVDAPAEQLGAVEESLGDACEAAALFVDATKAFEAARGHLSADEDQARLYFKTGMAEIRLGHTDDARASLDRSLALAEASGDLNTKLHAMVGIAGLELRRGRHREAGDWCDRVLAEGDEEHHPAQVARAYYNRSLVSSRMGRATATDEAQRALEIYERLGDKTGAANALNNLGTHAFYTGRWADCESYHLRNRAARKATGDVLGGALAGYNLGELYLEQGRYDEALPLLVRTLTDFRGAGHLVGESATLLTIGRLQTRTGELEEAAKDFALAESLARAADAGDQLAESALGRCELALANGDLATLEEALAELPADLTGPSLVRRHLYTAALLRSRGDQAGASEALSAARSEAASVGAMHLEFAADEMEGRLFGGDTAKADVAAESLGMIARPVYRVA